MEDVQDAVQTAVGRIKAVDPKLAKRALAAKIDGRLVDLSAVAPEGAEVEAVTPESPEALEIYRHSTAHLLAAAVLDLFPGTKLGVGPALTADPNYGFYYDFLPSRPFTPDTSTRSRRRCASSSSATSSTSASRWRRPKRFASSRTRFRTS